MNRRITVLQTAALPLGYAAVNRSGLCLSPRLILSFAGESLPRQGTLFHRAGHALARDLFYHWGGGVSLPAADIRLWSGKRDLNPRLQPWQGCTLPLSYSRRMCPYHTIFLGGVSTPLMGLERPLQWHKPPEPPPHPRVQLMGLASPPPQAKPAEPPPQSRFARSCRRLSAPSSGISHRSLPPHQPALEGCPRHDTFRSSSP